MDDSSALLLVGVIFIAIGAIFIGLGIFFFIRTRRFLRTAVEVNGTIVELRESSGSEGGTVYSAVVEFQTADARSIRWEESMASNPPAGQPGERLVMKYDPANPNKARIAKATRMWFMPMLFGGLGLLFFVIGVVLTIAGALAR
ncbi:MAG TPA: DUF3592 domain-containing protein [Acidimicrobiia bacterium]|nr:DUF3592 domain-containing protein [Acidimicrobiia bacterium]